MRRRARVCCVGTLIIVIFGLALDSARAAPTALYSWFARATAWNVPGTEQKIAAPDFLRSLCEFKYDRRTLPSISAFWSLLKYDRKHQIGLAAEHNDGHGCAVFKAPTPPATAPDADLSQAGTTRGLGIGSTYAQVLAAYGPPAKRGQHFVTSYSASVPGVTVSLPRRTVALPQRISLVIDNGRVSSIVIYVDEGGLY
jgi:hypothetical protein